MIQGGGGDDASASGNGSASANKSKPRGSFGAIGASGAIYGWAFDPDDPAASIEAHYYVVTPAGIREPLAAVLADLPRADINSVFNIDGDHGVSFSIPAKYHTGEVHTLQMYAIDPAGGVHPQVASRRFTLAPSSGTDQDSGSRPAVAVSLNYAVTGSKRFEFSWVDATDATYYQLFENPDGQSGFSQVGGNIAQGEQSTEHTIPLFSRLNAQYLLQSCNDSGCVSSAIVSIGDKLDDAIGVLENSTENDDGFGWVIEFSADGSTLAIGSPFDNGIASGIDGDQFDHSGNAQGAVFVFVQTSDGWQQQAYIKASNPDVWDLFGLSLALSGDGNTLVVGAYTEDSNAVAINGSQTNNSLSDSGAVYAFSRSNGVWQQQAYIKPTISFMNGRFGAKVSLSADGNTLAVAGNPSHVDVRDKTYIFKRNANVWGQASELNFSDLRPGKGLEISGDGRTLAISSDAYKAVYVYRSGGGVWKQDGRLTAHNTALDDGFGSSASGSISISGDGSVIAVGAHADDSSASGINSGVYNNNLKSSGAAYIFTRAQAGWSQQAYIKPSNPNASDVFGFSVDLSTDGTTLAVGSLLETSLARGLRGDQWDNSSYTAGAAYIFRLINGQWQQQAYVKAGHQSYQAWRFGNVVSLSGDASVLAVGAKTKTATDPTEGPDSFGRGAVYLY